MLKSKKIKNIIIALFSILMSVGLYFGFFMDKLPLFFPNMENIEKNILALLILIVTIYILLKIVFLIDTKKDRYILLLLYLFILVLGLLRPDKKYGEMGSLALNPFGFISDIEANQTSILTLAINLVIFAPMYFLLTYTSILNKSFFKILFFESFSILLEVLQFKLNVGTFDLSDILVYNISFFTGYFISLPVLNLLRKLHNKTKEESSY